MARLFPAVRAATSRAGRPRPDDEAEPDAEAPAVADRRPALVLAALVVAYVVVFGRLTWAQQSNFGTFGFDMGIYDQGLGNAWTALVLAAAYLLYPALEWINWWHFHPDALIITPLLAAWLLATRRRWRLFAVAVAVALLCKEDAALAVLALGAVLAVRGQRRAGAATAIAGVAWFALATRVVIPWANHGVGPLYEDLFPQFGNSVGEIFLNVLRHPGQVAELALRPDRLTYYTQLLAPVAFVPLLAPLLLVVGVPQAAVNVISAHGYTHDIHYHYTAIVVAAVFLATVEACARLGDRPSRQRFLVGLVAAAALAANVAWSPSPVGVKFHSGIWASPQPKHVAVRAALRQVPAGAGVSATYYLVPHLTHRVHIYEWPNPWVVTNWGVRGENPPDPADADYLLLDTVLNGQNQSLYTRLTGKGGEFRVIWSSNGIVVARRVRPG